MEVDQIQRKSPRISNGYRKFASTNLGQNKKMNTHCPDDEEGENRQSATNGGGVGRFYGWPSSRIVRVARASGGKDRHSKILTSKGLRDRRVRLSVPTAIQFYDLQDRLGYDQPSKAVEWLLSAAASSIAELPPIDTCFPDISKQLSSGKKASTAGGYQLGLDSAEVDIGGNSCHFRREPVAKSSAGSSNSETSKGSGISISRSENQIKSQEQVKERVAEKDKEIDNKSSYVSSFSELLSRRINFINESAYQDYFTSGLSGPPTTGPEQIVSSPLFSAAVDRHHSELQPFSFAPDNLVSAVNSPGFATINRGTLQSNSPSPPGFPPPPNFFTFAAAPMDNHHHFVPGFDARLQLYYSDAHGSNAGRQSGQKEKSKK